MFLTTDNIKAILFTAVLLYTVVCNSSCVKEEKKDKEDYLFIIDEQEYGISSVLFDYNRMKAASDTIEKSHSLDSRQIRMNFIYQFINEELLYQEAKRKGIKAENSQIEAELLEMKDGHTDMTFGTYLSSMMLTEAILKEKIERRILIEKLINSLVKDIKITDSELKEYYDLHKNEFRQSTMCRMKQIVVKTRDEAQNIVNQLKKGTSFEELAILYSESPEKRNGGDLGFLPEDSIDEYFTGECRRLKEQEISSIIESSEGYRIYKMVKRIPGKELSFEETKEKIRIQILDEQREREKNSLLRRLRAEHKIIINEQMLEKLN
ncbi:MAG: peptidyl-prolyl cis-trans isomerase [Deltaproteobacteria bacterium]|nr:peptidyl-prolyl cis-trans isomerase [Deltaproteobacteria bacterium]